MQSISPACMEKDDDEKEKPVFPPEYAHLEEPLKEAREQIRQIDQAIENLPKKKGPTLSYRPPGADDPNAAFRPEKTVKRLNQQRDDVSRNFEGRVYRETKNADPKLASHLRGIVKHKLGKAEDKDKTPSELKAIKGEEKKMDRSFGYMESLHYSRFTHEKKADAADPGKKQYSLDDMSDRFMGKLNVQQNKTNEDVAPKNDIKPEKQQVSLDKMSDRFMEKLKRQPEKPKQDRAPSKDDNDLDKE